MPTIKDQLILHEGLKLKPYVDTVGKVTIGAGRNLSDKGISESEALKMLDSDIAECELDLMSFSWWHQLDPIRQKVLIDMRFNLGPARFRSFKNTLKFISQGKYKEAATNMLASKWAEQVKGRAKRLAKMMETGEDYIN